ncbi:hypothetical protein [Mameliella sediminis]|uniref:hypothetical protein n=1 Tax=Mameliella sediminis TaxID=2836866 RepID=UPI001C45F14A|nr:hypothetical protein [Mameliella sediminis]MBV7394898.1 hypothetical protein [Mameliella sediminis]
MKWGLCVWLMATAGNAAAEPVTYAFEWQGSGGYVVKGALQYDSDAVTGPFVREHDLACFVIEGRKEGDPVGRWALTMVNEQTSWRLHFDPATGSFVVDGQGVWMPQAWNMNGEGDDCGPGGFGFNIGNAAQDICVDDTLIFDSQVAPDVPFPAVRVEQFAFPGDACNAPAMLSLLQ